MEVKSSRIVDVNLSNNQHTPSTKACAFMPNGQLLLTDNLNHNIKLLDRLFRMQDVLVLQASPWDIAALDDSSAIVTLPGVQKLQYIHMTPQLSSIGDSVPVDSRCYGICIVGDEIFVSCCKELGDSDIRVLDIQGNEKKRMCSIKDGPFVFYHALYITVSPSREKIYVSDWADSVLYCLSNNGTVLYQYKDETLDKPCALYVDDSDNVVVASEMGSNVQVISENGRTCKTLLSSEHGLGYPKAIAYRNTDQTLAVGCSESSKIFIFKLA